MGRREGERKERGGMRWEGKDGKEGWGGDGKGGMGKRWEGRVDGEERGEQVNSESRDPILTHS